MAIFLQFLLLACVPLQSRRGKVAAVTPRESEERMTFTTVSANLGIWQFDRATNELCAIKYYRTNFGLNKNVPLGRDIVNAIDAIVSTLRQRD